MLLERDQELGLLAGLLPGLESSGGKVVLIRGEAGIGKSSLVMEFIDDHADEAHVHIGSCDDLFIPQALAPFWDIARGEPSLRESVDEGDRPRLLEAVMELFSRSLRPTIMVIEDTQWADEATFDAIKYLGRRIARTRALLVLTYRDGPVDYEHPLRGVIGDLPPDNVVRIKLGGLSLAAVSSIISESALDPAEVMAATNGNPFLVTELASAHGEVVPSSIQDSVMARVRKLTPAAHEMLKALSVIPEPLTKSDVLCLTSASESRLRECEQHGLLDVGPEIIDRFAGVVASEDNLFWEPPIDDQGDFVAFRHELIRRVIEDSLTSQERSVAHRVALADLPEDTHPCLLIHCAQEAGDIDRLIDLASRSARYAAATGSHREAVMDFQTIGPHLDRFDPADRGPILDEWSLEEHLVDNLSEAIRLNGLALEIYREAGDRRAQSRTLAEASQLHENIGQRVSAEQFAQEAVNVLGSEPNGSDLARALEAQAYLHMMAGNISSTAELVERTLAVAGPETDERIIIRSLNHRGIVANIANYPDGRVSLDEARERSEAAGQWYEEGRALLNHAWAALEHRDLPIASDYAQRAIASGTRHGLPATERYAMAFYARVLDLEGRWTEAEDLAHDFLDSWATTQMVALPVLGVIEARKGRNTAHEILNQAWSVASVADEFQRLGPAAIALAEHAWITGVGAIPAAEMENVLANGLERGFTWSTGALAMWLWKLGELTTAPEGIAEPYRLLIDGFPTASAEMWATIGCPYERAIALTHGEEHAQLEALEALETLGATAVATKLRQTLRDRGVFVPRGKGQKTRSHAAGLTARQAEVLSLLDEDLTNVEIADRLFVSPRTVEHHVSAVLSKLESSTRAEAVATASQQGLLPTK